VKKSKPTISHLFVGSTNPVKIKAVALAVAEHWPQVQVVGYEVASGVSEQPRSDEETHTGSLNRAKAALAAGRVAFSGVSPEACLAVGLEGGVTTINNQLHSTIWVSVVDSAGCTTSVNGGRFELPAAVAEPILGGQEMGPALSELLNQSEVSKKAGMIGVITEGFIDRTETYTGIAKLAIGLWYGRNWHEQLKKKSNNNRKQA